MRHFASYDKYNEEAALDVISFTIAPDRLVT